MKRRGWMPVAAAVLIGAGNGLASMSLYPPQHLLTGSSLDSAEDPVTADGGAYYFALPLLELGGPMKLGFTLHYHSTGARSNWDLNDFPEGGPWWWDPMATCMPDVISGTNCMQFQIEAGDAVAFTENPDGSWRLVDSGDFGLANSPVAFQMRRTNDWCYFLDPRNGRVKMFEYTNGYWRIGVQADRNGNALHYTYRPNPTNTEWLQPIRIEDDYGRGYDLEYAVQGYDWEYYIVSVTDDGGRQVKFEYETGGDIAGSTVGLRNVVDVMGGTNRFTYAPFTNGYVIYRSVIGEHRQPAGNTPWTQQYGAFQLYPTDGGASAAVTNQTDAYGNRIALQYDTNTQAVTASLPNNGTNNFLHAGRNQPPVEFTDAADERTLYSLNANQQVESVTDREGGTTGWGYDPDTRQPTAITNPLGEALTFDYQTITQTVVNPVNADTVEFEFHDLAARHYPDGTSETFERDARGNVTGRVDRAGNRWSYEYDGQGNLLRLENPAGGAAFYTYTTNALLETATTAGGGTNVFTYDEWSRPAAVTQADGTTLAYGYDLRGSLVSVSNSSGDVWTYAYDANGSLTNATGPTGAEKSYALDLMGRVATNLPSDGAAAVFEYDAMGRAVRIAAGGLTNEFQRDRLGRVTNFQRGRVRRTATYDRSGRLATTARDGFGSTEIQRDGQGLATGIVNSTGYAIQYFRDVCGTVTQAVDSLARTTRWTVVNGQMTTIERPDGTASQRTYEDDRLTAYTDFGGGTWRFRYTPEGLLAAVTNPAGGVRQLFHDACGRPTELVLENGASWEYAYDARGDLADITAPGTATWHIVRNAMGRPLAITNPAGGAETRTYTADGLPETYSSTDTGVFSNQYDALRRPVQRTRPDGGTATYVYEPTNGWLESVVQPGGGTHSRAYDAAGRLASLEDPDGPASTFSYDGHGRVTGIVARADLTLSIERDAAGRVTAVTDGSGTGRRIEYDELDRPVRAAFGGITNHFEYDAAGRLSGVSNSLAGGWRCFRDAAGVVTSQVDAAGREMRFQSDAAGVVTNIFLPGGESRALAYDADGNLTRIESTGGIVEQYGYDALGGLTEYTDPNGNIWTVERSPMGRVQAAADPLGRTNRYEYDANGWLAQREYPDGSSHAFQYDLDGNVTAEVFTAAGAADSETNTFAYDARGKLVEADGIVLERDAMGRVAQTVCNGETNTAVFDAAGRLTGAAYGSRMAVNYQYDPATGRITNQTDSLTGTWIAYAYDARGRLAGLRRSSGQDVVFTRGEDGSVTRIADGDVLDLEYAYDANGRIASVSGTWPLEAGASLAADVRNWNYNAAGQVTNAGFAYNDRGQCIATPAQTLEWRGDRPAAINGKTMIHSGLDHLLEVQSTSAVTRFSYNLGVGDMPVSEDDRLYVWSPAGKLLYFVDTADANRVYHYHGNAEGSILAISDGTGGVVKAYAYDPQGRIMAETGTLVQPFTFGGENGLLRVNALAEDSGGARARQPRDEEEGTDGDLYYSLLTAYTPLHPQDLNDPKYIQKRIAVLDGLIEKEEQDMADRRKKIDAYEAKIADYKQSLLMNTVSWIAPGTHKAGLDRHYEKVQEMYDFQQHSRKQIEKYDAERQTWEKKLHPPPPVTERTKEIDRKIAVYEDLVATEKRSLRERRKKIEKAEDRLHTAKAAYSLNALRWIVSGPGDRYFEKQYERLEELYRFQQHTRQQIEKYEGEIEKLEAEKAAEQQVETLLREAEQCEKNWKRYFQEAEAKVNTSGQKYSRGWVRALKIIKEAKALASPEEQAYADEMDEILKEASSPPPPENQVADPVAAPKPETEDSAAIVENDSIVNTPAFEPANFDPKAGAQVQQWTDDQMAAFKAARNTPVNAGELWQEHMMRKAEYGYDPQEELIDPATLRQTIQNTPVNAGELYWKSKGL